MGKIHDFDWVMFNSYVKLPEGTWKLLARLKENLGNFWGMFGKCLGKFGESLGKLRENLEKFWGNSKEIWKMSGEMLQKS